MKACYHEIYRAWPLLSFYRQSHVQMRGLEQNCPKMPVVAGVSWSLQQRSSGRDRCWVRAAGLLKSGQQLQRSQCVKRKI